MAPKGLAGGTSDPETGATIRAWIVAFVLLLSGLALLAGWNIVSLAMADLTAAKEPARALRWRPDHPQALLNLAEHHLAQGRLDMARASARRVLAAEPLEGRGFTILAQAEALQGQSRDAAALYAIAAQRSPRDLRAHAWLIEHFLISGRHDDAMRHVDVVLRVAPWAAETILPWLGQLASDPVFADALARRLQSNPRWRPALVSLLYRESDSRARDAVLESLLHLADLSDTEAGEWISQLLAEGRWEKGYGIWASRLEPEPDALAMVVNGDFESGAESAGFGWQHSPMPGVSTDVVPARDVGGHVAHVKFRGRPVASVNLEQPLLLSPGRYLLGARMRALALRSDSGLEWSLTCKGQFEPIAVSERVAGSFKWRQVRMEVTVPNGCLGQWLRLRNPAPGGLAQQINGEVWFDDVFLQPVNEGRTAASGADPPILRGGLMQEAPVVLKVERGWTMVGRESGFAKVNAITKVAAGDRVLLLAGAVARLDYGNGCQRRLAQADVHVVATHCPARILSASTPVVASHLAADLQVSKAILRDMGTRPPVPAGR